MIRTKDHRRLLRANQNSTHVTHHVADNGQVHNDHPRMCSNPKCRAWGEELMNQGITVHQPKPHPVYIAMGVLLIVLMAIVAVGVAIVVVRNVWP